MELKFTLLPGVLRVEVLRRETAEETRALADAVFAEREKHAVLAVLMVGRQSRPIFKVEQYGLSDIFTRMANIPGLRIASVAEDQAMQASQQYIELLAKQRQVSYRTFNSEAEALAWLKAGAVPS